MWIRTSRLGNRWWHGRAVTTGRGQGGKSESVHITVIPRRTDWTTEIPIRRKNLTGGAIPDREMVFHRSCQFHIVPVMGRVLIVHTNQSPILGVVVRNRLPAKDVVLKAQLQIL